MDPIKDELYIKLENINSEIRQSWIRDCDKTEYMKELTSMLQEILSKNSLEEYFTNPTTLNYFMTEFLQDVINNILIQPIIYGEDGDQIALELLYNIFLLFMKFHKNLNYSHLFERVRSIFHKDGSCSFFSKSDNSYYQSKEVRPEKKYNFAKFNEIYCSNFKKVNMEQKLNIGDEVDFPAENEMHKGQIDKKAWMRGVIVNIEDGKYEIQYCEPQNQNINIEDFSVFPKGTKTLDWEWRLNLQKYDLVDCYDRNKWYPGTVMKIQKDEINGFPNIKYTIGFRVYPEHFLNTEEPEDTFDKHLEFWSSSYNNAINNDKDSEGEQYYGDKENFDEIIPFYSKKIQKFNTFSKVQKKNLDYTYSYSGNGISSISCIDDDDNNIPIKVMNDKLEEETEGLINNIDDFYYYEKDGKKNYVLGKPKDFRYYYASFLKKLEENGFFPKFIEILENSPNYEEIYTIFFMFTYMLNYVHKNYFEENFSKIKDSLMEFINNLNEKAMRNLPKDLIEIVSNFLKEVNNSFVNKSSFLESQKQNPFSDLYCEISLSLAMKAIKTSIFDKRLQGIKTLNDYINKNKDNKERMKKIVQLLKKNELINEIFGPNYHSQIISKSIDIVKILILENELSDDDIKLIWSCTKRGDLEAKLTILNLLSELAPNLKPEYISMLLNNILNSVDSENNSNKINQNEIELVYKLSIQGTENTENMIKCCDYLCRCLLSMNYNDINLNNPNAILEKLLILLDRDDKYIEKVLSICENCLINNNKALLSYSILFQIIKKYSEKDDEGNLICTKDPINNFIINDHLLNLFKDNFYKYISIAKETITKENYTEDIDKLIIDNFTHLQNIKKRMECFLLLINNFYTEFDFLPFAQDVLIDKAVSPNDQLIFYDFVKDYISNNEDSVNQEKKTKLREQLFKIFTEKNQANITLSQFELFIAIFFDMNHGKINYEYKKEENNYEIESVENLDDIIGLAKLWTLTFQIKNDNILSHAINIIFQIYKKSNIKKLLEKCYTLIKVENSSIEIIDKCIKLLNLIIIESEKNVLFKPKSHLSLLKNCLINLPLEMHIRKRKDDSEEPSLQNLLYGNLNINDLKILLCKKYHVPIKSINISLNKDYLNKLQDEFFTKNNIPQKKYDEDKLLDSEYNNNSLYYLLYSNQNENQLKPKEKIKFEHKQLPREQLLINGKMNPKLTLILKEWFEKFTEGTGEMNKKGVVNFIKGVTSSSSVSEGEKRVTEFIEANDKDKKGYINEEEFINFYLESISKKNSVVWDNLKAMGVEGDLQPKNKPYNIDYVDNNNLPRFQMGNDEEFIKILLNLCYKNNENKNIRDLLFNLSTNLKIYENLINDYNNNDDKEFFFNNKINLETVDNNKIEILYTFIIIESIFEELEIYYYLKGDNNNEINGEINLGNEKYKLTLSQINEPFENNYDNKESNNINKNIDFIINFINSKNYTKLIDYINEILTKLLKSETTDNILISCFEKGLKIFNLLNNICNNSQTQTSTTNENTIRLNQLSETGIYNLGYCNLSSLFTNKIDITSLSTDINNSLISFVKNIISYLKNNKITENNPLFQECYDILINIISSKKELLSEESTKQSISDLFRYNLTNSDSNNKSYFLKNLTESIKNAKASKNNEFLLFIFDIVNSLLDNLVSKNGEENKFTPGVDFFELYNQLYNELNSYIAEIKNKDDENVIKENNNDFTTKIYNILMNDLTSSNEESKLDTNSFAIFMKLLTDSIDKNENLKQMILTKEINNTTFFKSIISKLIDDKNSQNKNTIDENNDDQSQNETNEESKFICLENIQENKQPSSKNDINLEEIYHNFIKKTIKNINSPNIFIEIFKILNFLKKNSETKNNKNSDDEEDENSDKETNSTNNITNYYHSEKSCGHVGLKNLGCICYMNSIMQQIYMVPTFRYAIMQSDDNETPKPSSTFRYSTDDDNLLHQLQNMYTYLTFSDKMDYNPKEFCYSFKDFDGKPTNPGVQQDSQEFYNNFCDKIENSLKKTKFKYIVNDVFTGRTCSSVICQSCNHISNRFEDFYNLTVELKNINNLNDSLHKLIVPEIIDDFKCSNCNQKVTINKITSLSKLPNVLVVHLKRFYMNYEIFRTQKIDSFFEFPKKLNLKKFCVEELTKNFQKENTNNESKEIYYKEDIYYEYELKGINVHTGSADGGHYFSFIDTNREGEGNILLTNKKDNWLQFNDSHVSNFDTDTIPAECYGGSQDSRYSYENCQNAYLLIYERKRKTPIRVLIDENSKELKNFDENKIVKFDNDNKVEIFKEYDISKVNSKITEKELYDKIFFDKEKSEYFKYIPYYGIKKYAPRKVYNEVMKDNNNNKNDYSKPNKINNFNTRLFKEYKKYITDIVCNENFNINCDLYSNDIKEKIISIILHKTLKAIPKNSNSSNEREEKEKNGLILINVLDKIITPLINENTDISILSKINKILTNFNYLKTIYQSQMDYYENNNTTDTDMKIGEKLSLILYNLYEIFASKKINKECNQSFTSIVELIQNIKTANSTYSRNNENNDEKLNENTAIKFIYTNYLFKLMKENEDILEELTRKAFIVIFLSKLQNENYVIRNILYEIIIFMIKNTSDYNNKLFILQKNEKPGENEFKHKNNAKSSVDSKIVELLFEEKIELLILLVVIFEYNDQGFSLRFNTQELYELFKYSKEKNKYEDFVYLLFNIITINDSFSYLRSYFVLGYPTLIIKPIPRENKINDSDSDENDNENENNNINENNNLDKSQQWPLFGSELLKEDINNEIYQYINPHHSLKNNYCLLSLLFPLNEKENKLKILNKYKKQIIYQIIENFYNRKNYSLFKYIYLTPARTINYDNLYDEMINFLSDEPEKYEINKFKEKFEIYKEYMENEIKSVIDSVKSGTKLDDYEENQINKDFICNDICMKTFIGFKSDVIPGKIIREEFSQIANNAKMAMFRIEYYTKYHTIQELRELLNKKNENNDDKKEEGKKEDEKKEDEKKENEKKEDEKKEDEKKEDEKKEDDKKDEEQLDKDEETKDEETKEEDSKEEEKNEEEEPEKEEELNTEIKENNNYDLHTIKCDIKEKNENDFLYNILTGKKRVIFDDDSLIKKDKNNVKGTVVRFILTCVESIGNKIKVKIAQNDTIPEIVKLNIFVPLIINDKVKKHNYVNFHTIHRVRGDLPFVKQEHLSTNIDCDHCQDDSD